MIPMSFRTFLAAATVALVPLAQAGDAQPDWHICPDGRAYALAADGVRIEGEERAIPTGPADVLGCGPRTLLIGRHDGDRTWVTAFHEAGGTWQRAGEPVEMRGRALALAGDAVHFAASFDARRGGVLVIYDVASGRRRTEFTLGAAPPSLALARRGTLLLAATREQIRLYTWPEGLSVEVLEVPGAVLRLQTTDTAPHRLAVSVAGSLLVFDLRDPRERGALPVRARVDDGARNPAAVRSALDGEEPQPRERLAPAADGAKTPAAEIPAETLTEAAPEPVPAPPSESVAEPLPVTASEAPASEPLPESPEPVVEPPPAQPPALEAPVAPGTVAPATPEAEPIPAAPAAAPPAPRAAPVEPGPAAPVVPIPQAREPAAVPSPDSGVLNEAVSPEAGVSPRDLVVTFSGRTELVAEIDVRGPDNRLRSFGRFARPEGSMTIRVADLPPGRYTIIAMGAGGASLATVPELADIEKTDGLTARAEIRVVRAR